MHQLCELVLCVAATAGLAGKEHSNPQFMFLKPTHSMFGFFTSLCDAYSRVLMPDKGHMQKLHQDASDRYTQQCCSSYVTPVHASILFMLRSCQQAGTVSNKV